MILCSMRFCTPLCHGLNLDPNDMELFYRFLCNDFAFMKMCFLCKDGASHIEAILMKKAWHQWYQSYL